MVDTLPTTDAMGPIGPTPANEAQARELAGLMDVDAVLRYIARRSGEAPRLRSFRRI